MIVRDRGDSWQVVLQPDHADLSAQFARAWGNAGFSRPAVRYVEGQALNCKWPTGEEGFLLNVTPAGTFWAFGAGFM